MVTGMTKIIEAKTVLRVTKVTPETVISMNISILKANVRDVQIIR